MDNGRKQNYTMCIRTCGVHVLRFHQPKMTTTMHTQTIACVHTCDLRNWQNNGRKRSLAKITEESGHWQNNGRKRTLAK